MSAEHFTPEVAAQYDARFAPLAAIKEALHLVLRGAFASTPADARVLCVGAGTGAELIALAAAQPGWRFTVVEPAEGMIEICRQRASDAGISDRCAFHCGYLDALAPSPLHHAATAILVSQFILDPAARRAFYEQIATRLVPGGLLVTGDLIVDDPRDWAPWLGMMALLGMDAAKQQAYRAQVEEKVALATAAGLGEILVDAGFVSPTPVFQAGMIRAHLAEVAGPGR